MKKHKTQKLNLDKNIPKISGTVPKEIVGYHMEPVNRFPRG